MYRKLLAVQLLCLLDYNGLLVAVRCLDKTMRKGFGSCISLYSLRHSNSHKTTAYRLWAVIETV